MAGPPRSLSLPHVQSHPRGGSLIIPQLTDLCCGSQRTPSLLRHPPALPLLRGAGTAGPTVEAVCDASEKLSQELSCGKAVDDSSDEVPCYCGDHCPQNPGLRKTSKSQKTQLQKIILNVSVIIPQKAKIFISHLFTQQIITEHLLCARLWAGHLAYSGDDSQVPVLVIGLPMRG